MMCVRARAIVGLALLPALLAACSGTTADEPSEVFSPRPWRETLAADGELRAARTTPLGVPGVNFENRMLLEVVPDGSRVVKDQLLARFDAAKARVELDQAEVELLRNALADTAQNRQAAVTGAQIDTDIAGVDGRLVLSQRYAGADLLALSRNEILDALDDVGYLTQKRGFLDWRRAQGEQRVGAARAVIASQRDTFALTAQQKRESLDALELRAPHDGIFRLEQRWDGTKPQVGASLWAGQPFAALPDASELIARFNLPQAQAHGLKPGLAVAVRLAGTGTVVAGEVIRVGNTASVRGRDNPIKYIDFDARLALDAEAGSGFAPGQAVRGVVTLFDKPQALTVPNVALVSKGEGFAVRTADGVLVPVVLGERGAVRSEVIEGLTDGTRIALVGAEEAP
jgi:HlyD family secretion protein